MEQIANGIWRIRLGTPEELTPVSVLEPQAATERLRTLPAVDDPPAVARYTAFRTTPRGSVVELPISGDEQIYGFGLQLKSFNQKGRKKHLRTNADPVADTGDTHAPVPLYVSTAGYAVLVDTARYASFYCGSSIKVRGSDGRETKPKETPAHSIEELYSATPLSDGRHMVIEVPGVQGVDLYFFAGPDLRTAVQRYNLFSGGGCIPPCWGLGIWYRTESGFDAQQVLELARTIRDDNLPCDVLGLEPGWLSHSYSCSFTWDPERFPDPDSFIRECSGLGFRLNLWEHVFTNPASPLYEQLKPYAGDYEVWNGLVPDLSIAPARDIFAGYHRTALVEKGISGFKLDECDGSDFTGGWSFPNCAQFPSGLDGEQMHTLLGVLYQRTLNAVFEDKNLRSFNAVRASHAFAAPLPFVLYSDLYGHADFIRGVANAGFSGLLWTPEVRQCDSNEDLLRRLQTAVFSPMALVNAWMVPNPPWYQVDYGKNRAGELLENREELIAQTRALFELRMSLIPYIYSAFARYHFDGIPPFRALVMDYPDDEATFSIDDQYLTGDSILVAPLVAGQRGRDVYLPRGTWCNLFTGDRYSGAEHYHFNADPETMLVFVREGTILPWAEPRTSVGADPRFRITAYCYGNSCGDAELFEDDGHSGNYGHGHFNRVVLKQGPGGVTVERTGTYGGRMYELVGYATR